MNWPLMRENITMADLTEVRYFCNQAEQGIPRLTQGPQVAAFEREFADWLGCQYAVMVNSGSSANLITLAALRDRTSDSGEIIVPTITWSSDIAAVIHAGYRPVFVDIDQGTLGMDWSQVFKAINKNTKAVFITHVLGFNALPHVGIRDRLAAMKIELIEDCCEATGATIGERKLGTLGLASNFSFYYAHHMSTIEGGMVCTDDHSFYERLRQFRSHGLLRERTDEEGKRHFEKLTPDLDPEFIFSVAGYNVRSTEINAVIGRSQLKRLDDTINARKINLGYWLHNLGPKFFTDYRVEGASNYALPLVLKEPDSDLMTHVIDTLIYNEIEFRRGTAGGGNQLRQPYLTRLLGNYAHEKYPQAEHVHFYGLYIGNYPGVLQEQIIDLCQKLNAL